MGRLRGREMKKKVNCYLSISFIGGLLIILICCLCIQYSTISTFFKEEGVIIYEVVTSNQSGIRDKDGDYSDWIELYNNSNEPINLKGYGLSDNIDQPFKWLFPDIVIGAKSFLIVYASEKDYREADGELHTNFKLNKDGDVLMLSDNHGEELVVLSIPKLESNQSFGLDKWNSQYAILSHGTPQYFNDANIVGLVKDSVILSEPIFSHNGGMYDSSFKLELSTDDDECLIYYTLDGSEPDLTSHQYIQPITISSREGEKDTISNIVTSIYEKSLLSNVGTGEGYKGTIVRARTYKNGIFSDEIITHSYFINADYNLPVVSLVTEADYLFGYENGIYVPGVMYDMALRSGVEDAHLYGNYSQRGKESVREAHIEVYSEDGNQLLSQNVGVKVTGNYSRTLYAKSLTLIANSIYDNQNTFQNVFFPNLINIDGEVITELKSLNLKTSGNDFNKTMFRDALIQTLASSTSLITQAYTPSILFINGEYWGIHNVREKVDRAYLSSHYNLNEDDITILNFDSQTLEWGLEIGDQLLLDEFNELLCFVESKDLSIQENYEYVIEQIDLENIIDYLITEIYCANTDWPNNNTRVWKSSDGKWRWLLFDLDYGFNCEEYNTNQDTLKYVLDQKDQRSTIMIRGLLSNEQFRKQYISKFYEYLDSIYSADAVLQTINEFESFIKPEILEHLLRWEKNDTWLGKIYHSISSNSNEKVDWENEVEILREFAKFRVDYLKKYLSELEHNFKVGDDI